MGQWRQIQRAVVISQGALGSSGNPQRLDWSKKAFNYRSQRGPVLWLQTHTSNPWSFPTIHFCVSFPISSILFGQPWRNDYTFLDHKLPANKALFDLCVCLRLLLRCPNQSEGRGNLVRWKHKPYSFFLACSQVGTEGKPCEIYSGLLHMATQTKHCMSPHLCNLATFNYLSLYNLIHVKESIEPQNSLPSVRENASSLWESFLLCQVAKVINNYPLDGELQKTMARWPSPACCLFL